MVIIKGTQIYNNFIQFSKLFFCFLTQNGHFSINTTLLQFISAQEGGNDLW